MHSAGTLDPRLQHNSLLGYIQAWITYIKMHHGLEEFNVTQVVGELVCRHYYYYYHHPPIIIILCTLCYREEHLLYFFFSVVRFRETARPVCRSSPATTTKKPLFIYDCEKAREIFRSCCCNVFSGQRRFRRRHRMGRQFFLEEGGAGFGVEEVAAGLASALQWRTLPVKATMAIAGPVSKAAESNGNSNATRNEDDECYLPPGVGPGHPMQVNVDGRLMTVTVPQGVYSGMQFQFAVPNTASPQQPACPNAKQRPYSNFTKPDGRNVVASHLSSRCNPGPETCCPNGQRSADYDRSARRSPRDCVQGGHPIVWATASFSGTNMQQQNSSMIQSLNNSYTGGTAQRVRVLPESQWQKDSAHATCQQCFTSFTLLNRKHHCRYCGRVLCDNCSSYKIKKLRACKMCFDTVYPNRQSYAGQPPGVLNPNLQAMQPQHKLLCPCKGSVLGANAPTVPQQVLSCKGRCYHNSQEMLACMSTNTMHAPVVQASAPLLSNDATAKQPAQIAQQEMSAPQESNSIIKL